MRESGKNKNPLRRDTDPRPLRPHPTKATSSSILIPVHPSVPSNLSINSPRPSPALGGVSMGWGPPSSPHPTATAGGTIPFPTRPPSPTQDPNTPHTAPRRVPQPHALLTPAPYRPTLPPPTHTHTHTPPQTYGISPAPHRPDPAHPSPTQTPPQNHAGHPQPHAGHPQPPGPTQGPTCRRPHAPPPPPGSE